MSVYVSDCTIRHALISVISNKAYIYIYVYIYIDIRREVSFRLLFNLQCKSHIMNVTLLSRYKNTKKKERRDED